MPCRLCLDAFKEWDMNGNVRARVGKIARLPEKIREGLNRRLLDGSRGRDMPIRLNALPEVISVGRASRLSLTISARKVEEWRQAGCLSYVFGSQLMEASRAESDLLGASSSYDHRGV